MAVEAILFIDDKLHSSVSGVTLVTQSTATESGYSPDNVRETEWGTAWKPVDSGVANGRLNCDLGSTSVLGAAGGTAYWVIAYDARTSALTNAHLQVNTNDDSSFADEAGVVALALNKTRPCPHYSAFTIPTPAKRWYGLKQSFGEGSTRFRVFGMSLYHVDGVYRIGTDYASDTTGPGSLDHVSNVQAVLTASRSRFTNRIAQPQQEIELSFQPASLALWEALRDKVYDLDGPKRAFYAQIEGIRNPAQQDFGMVRMVGERVTGSRRDRDQYEVTIKLVTEPYF